MRGPEMLPRLGPLLLVTALVGCRASSHAGDQISRGAKVENATIADLNLTSDAFRDGQTIPARFTCEGGSRTPSLKWSDPPSGTKSFALVLDDPDAPSGTFRHWGVFDIPASARSIGGGRKLGIEATNDFGKPGYGGPCPPPGHGAHHYHFKLFALDLDRLGLSTKAKVEDAEDAAQRHAIGRGELVGIYQRV